MPAHWTVDRLRWTIAGAQNGIWGDEPDGVNDIICVRVADFDRTTLTASIDAPTMRAVTLSERRGRVLQRGDLLLEKSGGGELQPVGAVVEYDHDAPAVCSNFVARVRVARGFDARFLVYLHSHLYTGRVNTRSIKQTTGIQNLDSMAYFDERVCWPPLPEQQAIAGWLDERTRRIDDLVAAKRRLLNLLAEQRTALITHAVTKGLNPAALMKPSGIDWLGDVPGHWEARRLRHLVSRIEQGWSPEADQREAGDDEWGVMRAGCANGGTFDETDNKALPPGANPDPSLEIRPGDLLMSRACGSTDLVGSVALVRSCRRKLLLCDKLFRLRYRMNLVTPEFLALAMSSRLIRLQLERDLSGAEGLARNIAQGAIKELVLCVPPVPEQRAIVAHLDAACEKLDTLTTTTETAIVRLTEYRQALISAAVTGKINVTASPIDAASTRSHSL